MAHELLIEKIRNAQKILIFTHNNMDGDALGSSAGLCRSLRLMGKEAFVLKETKVPDYLAFLAGDYFTDESPWQQELSVAVDIGDDSRLENRLEAFYSCPERICIDHHVPKGPFCEPCYVDPKACAAGALVYEVLKEMNAPMDKEVLDLLYTAIVTDTGQFKYENSGAKAMRIAADLVEQGADFNGLCNRLFDSKPLGQLRLEALCLENSTLTEDGKGIMSIIDFEDLDRLGVPREYTEGCIDKLRSVMGVELAALLKQRGPGEYKLSLRSKAYANVQTLALEFGGGGHDKAAGATLYGSREEVAEAVRRGIIRCLKES